MAHSTTTTFYENRKIFVWTKDDEKESSIAGHYLEETAGCYICHYPQHPVLVLYGEIRINTVAY
jgi:hypothetical protein